MSRVVSERSFEEAIECALLQDGPDACEGEAFPLRDLSAFDGESQPGGYRKARPEEYDQALCLLPRDVIEFIIITQPKEWKRLQQHHGADVKAKFLKRLATELKNRGGLEVLRHGVKDSGCKFNLAFFRPASGLNEEMKRLHAANLFAVARQVNYSEKNENSLDLALFLNGIPIFTAELKNPLTGQRVEDAIRQYKLDRDPREPLLAPGRCLAHFAVDPYHVYVTTRLEGPKTRFLPFNKGNEGGAGNPPVPPTRKGYSTAYLWEDTWARDSVLDLIRQFIHEVEESDERGRKTSKRSLIFPRYQQLDAVRRLIADARANGVGKRYLVQHSAGSGKSFTIAWLAHQLATLHDARDRRVFDTIVVVTDRRVLDRQLQDTMRQFEQTLGVVENIDQTSRQLRQALEQGKTIIVTTLQKFPVIADEIGELPGKRFAVIIDEAHSSQSGESTKSLKSVLAPGSLEAAEEEDAEGESPEEERDSRIIAEMERRGPMRNASSFAFTATPKPKTLELFGVPAGNGFKPFHVYSMRQAIEESFILDVLQNYSTYQAYWRLLKKIEDDPRYEKRKAQHLLKSFVELHPHAIDEKVRIMAEHFATQVQDQIGGQAKAMIVTRSRLHAVRYKLAVDRYLKERKYPFKTLVAFSGTVKDGGQAYTEARMNGVPETQTARAFERSEYRFLIAANKFQTGFDQPLLHTMYVDKKLGGVNAVQTLSRLNRTHPGKEGALVLDFANEAEEIRKAFQPYYEVTLLSEGTDPNLLYELQTELGRFPVFTDGDVEVFARLYFDQKATQDQLYAALEPVLQRVAELSIEERVDFRGQVTDYVRLYAFLSQILTFTDAELEKLYVFSRHLRRLLPADKPQLPVEVQQNIDMESYRLQQTSAGRIELGRGPGKLRPVTTKDGHRPAPDELEPLSQIIAELNERFGLNLGPEHHATLQRMTQRLEDDPALAISAQVNPRDNVRLTFDYKVEQVIQEIVELNFELYKKITDDLAFGSALKDRLFDRYLHAHRQAEELIKRGESKTLAFEPSMGGADPAGRPDETARQAVLQTIAAFLNTDGGDLLIGVQKDRSVIGLERDGYRSEDEFARELDQAVRDALGEPASSLVKARSQIVQGRIVGMVSCQQSPEPVRVASAADPDGRLIVRKGRSNAWLAGSDLADYSQTRFAAPGSSS
jgi:type I restriction enzyme R subunit